MTKKLMQNIAKAYQNVKYDLTQDELMKILKEIQENQESFTSQDLIDTKIPNKTDTLLHYLCYFFSGHIILDKIIEKYPSIIDDEKICNAIQLSHHQNYISSLINNSLRKTNLGQKILKDIKFPFLEVVPDILKNPAKLSIDSYESIIRQKKAYQLYKIGAGLFKEKKYNEAFEYFTKSTSEGYYSRTQLILGFCYKNGYGTQKNISKALKCYEKASSKHPQAYFDIAVIYSNDYKSNNIEESRVKAYQNYEKAANKGIAIAQNRLGTCYRRGLLKIQKNPEQAFKWYKKAAEQGYDRAQDNLGICYDIGFGTKVDKKEAFKWYKKAAEQGYDRAQDNLGICYDKGIGTKVDKKEAFKWYKKAAEQGDAKAQYNLGICYKNGEGTKVDNTKAYQWVKEAAEKGYAQAQNELGIFYKNGIGTEVDNTKAYQWFKKAAEKGHVTAQYSLGLCYINGKGTKVDKMNAHKWFKASAEKGYAPAQCNLGTYYKRFGEEQTSEEEERLKFYKKAFKWFKKAAKQRESRAELNLAHCYKIGLGTNPHIMKAIEMYKRVIDNNFYKAYFELGECYFELGSNIQNNTIQKASLFNNALKHFYKAATTQNCAKAKFKLGMCYENSIGVSENLSEAFHWYLQAANQGHSEAAYNLGLCHEQGKGTKPNFDEALECYGIAASKGNIYGESKILKYYDHYSTRSGNIFTNHFVLLMQIQKNSTNNDHKIIASYLVGESYMKGRFIHAGSTSIKNMEPKIIEIVIKILKTAKLFYQEAINLGARPPLKFNIIGKLLEADKIIKKLKKEIMNQNNNKNNEFNSDNEEDQDPMGYGLPKRKRQDENESDILHEEQNPSAKKKRKLDLK